MIRFNNRRRSSSLVFAARALAIVATVAFLFQVARAIVSLAS